MKDAIGCSLSFSTRGAELVHASGSLWSIAILLGPRGPGIRLLKGLPLRLRTIRAVTLPGSASPLEGEVRLIATVFTKLSP